MFKFLINCQDTPFEDGFYQIRVEREQKILQNLIGDDRIIDMIKENHQNESQTIKIINEDLKYNNTLKIVENKKTVTSNLINLPNNNTSLTFDFIGFNNKEVENIRQDVEVVINEIINNKRKLLVYRLENNKSDYELRNSVISEQSLTKIKKKLKQIEKETEDKENQEFKKYMREIREKQINELKTKLESVKEDGKMIKTKLNEELSEANRLNDEINNKYKEITDIKSKLDTLSELRVKLEKSKKEVNKFISKQPNRQEYYDEMKKMGFILSYAGCLKIAIRESLNAKDVLIKKDNVKHEGNKNSDIDTILSFVKEKEAQYMERMNIIKTKSESGNSSIYDDNDEDDYEFD